MINFRPFPRIETKNFILRRMDCIDASDLFEMRKNPRMIEYIDAKLDESIHETKDYIDKMNNGIDAEEWIIWAMEHKKSKKVIGTISIWNINREETSAELGYGIIPDYQGQGLMKEALLNVVKYGFNIMNLKNILAYTEENNLKSIRLLERRNFAQIDMISEEGYFNNRTYNMAVYRLENQNNRP